MKAGAFLDRDGVVNVDRGYVVRPADFEFVPGTIEAARTLASLGFSLVIVTNQSGIARGYYDERDFDELTTWMNQQFAAHGVHVDGVYFCPHHPTEGSGIYRTACDCRKPAPGLLLRAARELGIELERSVLFGDKETDLEAARRAGIQQRVLLGTDGRELPPDTALPELATARFRSLADAVEHAGFASALKRLAVGNRTHEPS